MDSNNTAPELDIALNVFGALSDIIDDAPAGTYPINDDVRIAIVETASGVIADYKIEWHEKFTDTHIQLSNDLTHMLGGSASALPVVRDEFDVERDVGFLGNAADFVDILQEIKMVRDDFVFFDVLQPHSTGNYVYENPGTLFKKAIVKVVAGCHNMPTESEINLVRKNMSGE